MNWFYALDDQQIGPVSDAQLDELLHSQKINLQTLVWREGLAGWQPLQTVRSGNPAIPGAANVCVECGKTFPPDELVTLNRSLVCAHCKPIFLQRMAEGAAIPSGGGLWRNKNQIITVTGTVFPDRCIKCNAPANGFLMKRTIYWAHPAYFLLVLCNVLILLIVYIIVRKKAVVQIGLCEKHRAERKMGLAVGWTAALGGNILITSGIVFSIVWMVVAGVVAILFGGIYGALRANTITAAKISGERVWIKGARKDFLDTLPEWHGL